MWSGTRLRELEATLGAGDDPGVLIVLEDEQGIWRDALGTALDPATIDPRTQVIVFRQRPDGPQ